ncbi:hypothetical protein NHX12_023452 [Muraenolepis orangiensis]|uniref:Homeobox domain-containing protein n=1 Tax=Muraenolepis orangiensis TaxID=630683 RepID=A0A9Q0EKT7_9TELE|nr:hypothetical protein NHX12_023452 [Muraenolepis orangiensis]
MAYSHLGYSYSGAPQFLLTPGSMSGCLEPGGPALPPPHAYPKSQGYYNTCSSALYSRSPLDCKEAAMPAAMGASQVPAYYPYEYSLGQYPYHRYGYSCSDGASRRKNATRETTSTLKAWLQEHQKNPYPTKGEKIMLAIITRMTLTQVSTWFANARRRLKKENKVTWSPRACKSSEDRGCEEDSEGGREEAAPGQKDPHGEYGEGPGGLRVTEDAVTGLILPDQSVGDLQSDLEDFDLLESHGSDAEPEAVFVGEDRKVWSAGPRYPPCMLAGPSPSPPGYPSGGRRGSPVATLRDWVDGVFHHGPLRQRAPDRALSESAAVWEGLVDLEMDCGAAGRSY